MVECKVIDLYTGVNLFAPLFTGCTDSKLILGLKDSRIYVSVEFKDLKKEETIGIIEFNHWKLYKENTFDFDNTDEKLQVKDKQNNIVFSIEYDTKPGDDPQININGYFINPKAVLVVSENGTGEADSKGNVQVEMNKFISKTDSN